MKYGLKALIILLIFHWIHTIIFGLTNKNCYGLNMKCPPQAHVLALGCKAEGPLGSDWILRALT
jgi:hypothetical protein